MQFRFRYQPRSGSRVIIDVPARAEVALAFDEITGEVTFDIVRLYLNEVEVPVATGLHEDLHDYLCATGCTDIVRNLAAAGKNATAIARVVS